MGLEPITGLRFINKLLGLANLSITVDVPLYRYFIHFILSRQVKNYFRKIRKDDTLMDAKTVGELEDEVLNRVCFERGIEFHDVTR